MNLLRANGGARLFAATQQADAGKWSVLFPRGDWSGRNLASIGGSISLDDSVFAEMISNWKAQGSPALPIYWHHPPDISEVPPEDRKAVFRAAGHLEDFRVTARGLEARTVWGAEGQAALDGDEYRFISPEWSSRVMDRHEGSVAVGWNITGAALTDTPFFNEMPRVAASTAPTQSGPVPQEQQRMDKKLICAALGLPEDTADEAVMAAITKACAGVKCAAEVETKLTAATVAGMATREALALAQASAVEEKAKATTLAAEVETLKAGAKALELDTFLGSLTGFGAAQRECVRKYATAMGLPEAKAFASTMTPAAPMGVVGHGDKPNDGPADKVALKAAYDADLDAAVKAGQTAVAADRTLRNSPKFSPLFAV